MNEEGKHPSKKKHLNKPRPAVVLPLSKAERDAKAGFEFAQALLHLAEAERMERWGEAPNACIHSAYYAMYHCASAAILAAGGVGKKLDVPPSHEHVIQHFAKLSEGEAGYLATAGMSLSRARTGRVAADYHLISGASRAEASSVTAEARKFVDACALRWTLK